jgi:outer membrane biosynthesis protein TonB
VQVCRNRELLRLEVLKEFAGVPGYELVLTDEALPSDYCSLGEPKPKPKPKPQPQTHTQNPNPNPDPNKNEKQNLSINPNPHPNAHPHPHPHPTPKPNAKPTHAVAASVSTDLRSVRFRVQGSWFGV